MRAWRALLLVAVGAGLLAGCGGEDEPVSGVPEEKPPVTEQADGPAGSGSGGIGLERIGDFDQPLYVAQPPGSDDLYVVEQPGTIRLVRQGKVAAQPLLDIQDEVTWAGEQGLLSVAFAPDFDSSRLVYVYFTDAAQDQRVVEFQASEDGTSVEPGSRREVLHMDDFASNHNGGLLLFGPDDLLYIGTGDGGTVDARADPERNGQDLDSLLGKLLRIDPRESDGRPYSVPSDNPFVGRSGARPEVYSYGLRNPWRFSFDRETQALAIGDVGSSLQEEIDYVPAGRGRGANFGWSAYEGNERLNSDQEAPGYLRPVLTYGHDPGCSVTGGYVVRDPSLPSLAGRYLYGDYCTGELRSFVPSEGAATADRSLGLTVPALSSFGEDTQGHIYATSLDGPVFRLVAR